MPIPLCYCRAGAALQLSIHRLPFSHCRVLCSLQAGRHIPQPYGLQQPHFADSRASEQGNQSQGQCPNPSAPLSLLTKAPVPGTKACSLLCATQDALSKEEKSQERTLEDKQEQRPDALAETFNFLRRLRDRGEKSTHLSLGCWVTPFSFLCVCGKSVSSSTY